jgi:muramoyltetrapeptide carboxypeptidase
LNHDKSALLLQALRRPQTKARPVIGVFAPSSSFAEERYQKGRDVLAALDFEIYEPEGLRAADGYLAGADQHRVDMFHDLLDNDEIDILWAVRGGYGLHRILDRLDHEKLAKSRKTIVGFSDICALHAFAQAKANLISIHGPVITQLSDLPSDHHVQIKAILQQKWKGASYSATGSCLSPGIAEGIIVGGCLSVVAPLIGTPYLPPMAGSILLLEDVGEATYRIDRLLTHLKLAGVFRDISGLALGDFHACAPRNEHEPKIDAVLDDVLGKLNIPILSGLPFGHGKRNFAIPLGCKARLNAEEKTLKLCPDE